jgi:hypothetical protein
MKTWRGTASNAARHSSVRTPATIAYWHVVHHNVDYAELGPDWAQTAPLHRVPHPHQLEQLGHTVTLQPTPQTTGIRTETARRVT